jgi:hypothetical protein
MSRSLIRRRDFKKIHQTGVAISCHTPTLGEQRSHCPAQQRLLKYGQRQIYRERDKKPWLHMDFQAHAATRQNAVLGKNVGSVANEETSGDSRYK